MTEANGMPPGGINSLARKGAKTASDQKFTFWQIKIREFQF